MGDWPRDTELREGYRTGSLELTAEARTYRGKNKAGCRSEVHGPQRRFLSGMRSLFCHCVPDEEELPRGLTR